MTEEVQQIINNAWANRSYEEEIVSNCCSAPEWIETGLCSDCKEHAEFINLGDNE